MDNTQVWTYEYWNQLDLSVKENALQAPNDTQAWDTIVKQARNVLRTYSTSFFIVTRFLPIKKRARVEAIYAAVRYPDEIVDSFPISPVAQAQYLDEWLDHYDRGLKIKTIQERLQMGIPSFLAAFIQVVRDTGMPHAYYRSFIDAMRHDSAPGTFANLEDLIDRYIYGSATVVGYFLTYVYGSQQEHDFDRALRCARNLGIALQLTNFLRDVAEDAGRGRLYLPLDHLQAAGVDPTRITSRDQQKALREVLHTLANITEGYYLSSIEDIDAFSEDSRIAIKACIDVYRQLNQAVRNKDRDIKVRASVPIREKFRVLPNSKYWRLPLAYLKA